MIFYGWESGKRGRKYCSEENFIWSSPRSTFHDTQMKTPVEKGNSDKLRHAGGNGCRLAPFHDGEGHTGAGLSGLLPINSSSGC